MKEDQAEDVRPDQLWKMWWEDVGLRSGHKTRSAVEAMGVGGGCGIMLIRT